MFGLLSALVFIQFYIFPLSQISRNVLLGINSPYTSQSMIARAKGIYLPPNAEKPMFEAVEYIKTHTNKGEKIFVGNNNHDAIGMNNILFYFLAERGCGTRYHELAPGIATLESTQKTIINELLSNNVRYVVIEKDIQLTDTSGKGSKYLDNYLRSNYCPVMSNGQYTVLFPNNPGSNN
ncbi:MAG: hypothetical protein A2328_02020 [Bdellovibrionales bacterium RIFOXYB2_FULL_36_6]|nr:MAG: hypothetical protein A2328_02020 [Bdellovibrionales bacterium RIFOXYB2_FULL_36_6]